MDDDHKDSGESSFSIWFNYFYFGLLFSLLAFLCISSILTQEDFGGSRIFFILYSLGQAILEVILFIFAGWIIRRFFSNFWFLLFIAFTFTVLLLHLIDFLLERFLHFTLWETVQFVFDESFKNFLNMLDASGIPFWLWICGFGFLVFIPIIGILLYTFTEWLAKKHPLGISLEMIVQAIFCIPVALFLWDCSTSHIIHREAHFALIKTLPWKKTFFRPHAPKLRLQKTFASPSSESLVLDQISSFHGEAASLPNIYLFIVESLRDDFIIPSIAPTLSEFRDNSIHTPLSLSNANATQISWFSIFHSNFPYYWKSLQLNNWKSGSPALQLLRKLGYSIHVYSSANLSYYGMDELIFGENHQLASTFRTFPHPLPKEAWNSDQETLSAFASTQHPSEGQCIIFFWDATHFDYSWPKNVSTRFTPVAKEMNYFQAYLCKRQVESIKNRYRNSVNFIDGLFGQFLALLPPSDPSIIVFTGDHGEEFFEHGHLFHLSQLCDVQTQVPLYFKLPTTASTLPLFSSHMDLFPTIIHSLTGVQPPLNGQSLFATNRWPYAVLARYNASRTPTDLCFHNGTHKLIVHSKDFFHSHTLDILSLRTAQDRLFNDYKDDLPQWVYEKFGDAFSRLGIRLDRP